MKRIVYAVMFFYLAFCINFTEANAKTRLNNEEITIKVDKQKKIKCISGNVKKWIETNKNIKLKKKNKKSVIVVGVSKGMSWVKATTNDGKILECKINILGISKKTETEETEEPFEENISLNEMVIGKNIFIKVDSNRKTETNVIADCYFYSEDGTIISSVTGSEYAEEELIGIRCGETCFIKFSIPNGYSYHDIKYSYKDTEYQQSIKDDMELSIIKNEISQKVKIDLIAGTNTVNNFLEFEVDVKNNSDNICWLCEIVVVFYNENGGIEDIEKLFTYNIANNSLYRFSYNYEYKDTYARHDIILNMATKKNF